MPEKSRRPPQGVPDFLQMQDGRRRWSALRDFLLSLWHGYSGVPGLHATTHKLQTGSDALDAAAPINATGTAHSEGTAETVMRSDATIKQGIVTAKGNILTHSTVPAALTVGADATILTADSVEATGLKWNTVASIIGSGTANTVAKWIDSDTLGNSTTITDDGSVVTVNTATTMRSSVASDGTTNFAKVTGTLPASPSGTVTGVLDSITGAGSSAQEQRGHTTSLAAGYTGASRTIGILATNATAGTADDVVGNVVNAGLYGLTTGVAAGTFVAVHGQTNGGAATDNFGVAGISGVASALNVGVFGNSQGATVNIGGYFGLHTSTPSATWTSAALIADIGGTSNPIIMARIAGNDVFEIGAGGNFQVDLTVTAGGTTGAQTINKAAGTVNFAGAATTLVVTNSLCSTSSIVFATLRTNDATAQLGAVVPGSGSFTINMAVVPTAETSVGFFLMNDA